jgi:hypothetical protein
MHRAIPTKASPTLSKILPLEGNAPGSAEPGAPSPVTGAQPDQELELNVVFVVLAARLTERFFGGRERGVEVLRMRQEIGEIIALEGLDDLDRCRLADFAALRSETISFVRRSSFSSSI